MKLRKVSIAELGLASWLAMGVVVTTACTAADTVSAAHKPTTGGSGGTGTSGAAGTPGTGGQSSTGAGGTDMPNGGSANPATGGAGGAGGDAMVLLPDASSTGATDASDAAPVITCASPTMCIKAALIHRYSFDGTGTAATDSVGTAHGTVINGTLSGNGDVVLAAGDGGASTAPYVDLPNGIISTLTNATFEVWLTWSGGGNWQRIFDFGSSTGAENTQGSAATTFYLTPQAGGPTVMLAAFKRADQTYDVEARAQSTNPLMTGAMTHVAVVVDNAHTLMTLYRNGMPDGSVLLADTFSAISDVNNWLGRSQYGGDAPFGGTLHEFRIYNAALPPDVIMASFTAGPSATF